MRSPERSTRDKKKGADEAPFSEQIVVHALFSRFVRCFLRCHRVLIICGFWLPGPRALGLCGLFIALWRFNETALAICILISCRSAIRRLFLRLQAFGTFAITFSLTLSVRLFLLLAGLFHFGLGSRQKPEIVFRVLSKVFCRHPIARQLRITMQLIVLVDDLLRRTAYFSVRAGAVKDAIDDIATGRAVVVAVLTPRP